MGFNLRLVLGVLDAWPRATAILFSLLSAGGAFMARDLYGLSHLETALAGVAYLLCLSWLKIVVTLLMYPVLYRGSFEGSFLAVALIANAFLAVGVAILAALASVHERPVPAVMVTVGAFGYLVLSFVLGGGLRVAYWMQRDSWVPWRKLDER